MAKAVEFTREQLLAEYERRGLGKRQAILDELFDKQLQLIQDPSRRKAALCSRRAGKTYAVTRYLVYTCLCHPNTHSVYITLTRPTAEKLVWYPLQQIDRQYNLGIKFHNNKLQARFPNGSMLEVTGAADKSDIEKLRGGAYKLVVIDECASFPVYISTLIEEVIEPALLDYSGTLLVIGTPGAGCVGYFYDITTDPDSNDFSLHRWTILDNPKLPEWSGKDNWRDIAVSVLEELRIRRGYEEEDPKWQREYRGVWARGKDSMMYHIPKASLVEDDFIAGLKEQMQYGAAQLNFVLGIDLGWHDKTAFVVVAYDQVAQKVYEIETWQRKELIVDEIVSVAEQLISLYRPERIVVDGSGEGKIVVNSMAAEISQRYGIPVTAAEKTKKASFVRLLDSDIRVQRVLLRKYSELHEQMEQLQWDDKYMREIEGMPADMHDALLYAYRECLHWVEEEAEDAQPEYGTPEYWQMVSEQMEAEEERRQSGTFDEFELMMEYF